MPNLRHLWTQAGHHPRLWRAAHVPVCRHGLQHRKARAADLLGRLLEPEERLPPEARGRLIGFHPNNLLSIYALLHAAELGGGDINNMEPAWELLRSQKPFVGTVVTGSAEAVPYFENGEVWIAPFWSPRSSYYISRGMPFGMVIPEEGVNGLCDVAAIPVGAANKKLAYEFLNFRLDPEIQRAFSLAYHSSPARGDVTDWPDDFARNQIVTHVQMDMLKFPDAELIGAQRRDWTLKWPETMA